MFLKKKPPTLPTLALLAMTGLATACSNSGSDNSQIANNAEQQSQQVQTSAGAQNDGESQDAQTNQPSSVLSPDNANAVIMQVFEVFTGRAYDRRLSAYPYVKQAPLLEPANNALGYHFYYETLACEDGGEKSETVYEDGAGFDGFTFYDSTYANCSVGGEVLNGRAVLSGDTCCGFGYQKEFSEDFSVAFGGDGEMKLSGIYRYDYHVSVDNFNYDLTYSGGALAVMDATTSKTAKLLKGSFRVSPPVLENQEVSVTVFQEFENDEVLESNLSYARGAMQIKASDSEIIFEVNSTDTSKVNITINANGESIVHTEPWSVWFHALSFVPTKLGQDVNVATPDGDGTVLNKDSYRTILTEVFNVMTGERFGKEIVALPNYPYPEFPYSEVRDIYGFGEEITETCDNGGAASLRPFRWGYQQETTGWRTEFTDCTKAGNTFNGGFSTRYYGTYDYFSSGLTVSNDNSSGTFKGTFHYKVFTNRSDGGFPFFQYRLDNVYFDSTDINDQFVLSEADFFYTAQAEPTEDFATGASYSEMQGSFALSSKATGHSTIKVRVADALRFEHPQRVHDVITASSDKGVLHINAGNGNELYLQAVTGNSNTFNLFIYQPGQDPLVITEEWEEWQYLLGYNFDLSAE